MALTKISSNEIQPSAITADLISADVSLGVKISNVSIANSSYDILDDTAVSTSGGYIVITGAGFNSGAQVIIDNTTATSVTRISSTELRAQVPAKSAATYNVYVINTDGSTGIRVNGLTYSGTPTWVTDSTLDNQAVDVAFNVAFDATGATSYANTSALPSGTSLLANGYFYGTITGIEEETTYSFTISAIDAENQDSPRTFSVTVTVLVEDPYWSSTSLLFNANEVGQQKPVDITGNFDQFAVNPNPPGYGFISSGVKKYGAGSIGVNGTDMYLTVSHNDILDLGNGDFTVEFWLYPNTWASAGGGVVGKKQNDSSQGWQIYRNGGNTSKMAARLTGSNDFFTSSNIDIGEWHHWALVRYNSNIYWFRDGILDNSAINSSNIYDTGANLWIGRAQTWGDYYNGYLDDLRITKGVARYTSNFTPPGELGQYV